MKKYFLLSLVSILHAPEEQPAAAAISDTQSIGEIHELFKNMTCPQESLYSWVARHADALQSSTHTECKNLGELLAKIQHGKYFEVPVMSVVPTFVAAIKTKHPDFKMAWGTSPILIAKGTAWFSRSKPESAP